jgi:hypothetical protein
MKIMTKSSSDTKESSLHCYLLTNTLKNIDEALVSNNPEKRSHPIKFTRKRTDSEIQLFEDLLIAEYRDYCMLLRMRGRNESELKLENKTREKAEQYIGLEDTERYYNWNILDEKLRKDFPATPPPLTDDPFKFQNMDLNSSTSMPLPSLLFSMNLVPTESTKYDDFDYGIFDMEL